MLYAYTVYINQPMLCVNTGHTKYHKAHKLPQGNLCVDSSIKLPQVFTKTTCKDNCMERVIKNIHLVLILGN